MTFEIKKETRWSRKIIIGRLNKHLPFLRPIINYIRFVTFRNECPSYPTPTVVYSDGPWIERKVTKDQQAIEAYLSTRTNTNIRLLHVGIGSSSIAKKFSDMCIIDGLTVVQGEKEYADNLKLSNYKTYIIDKNDIDSLKKLPGNYDYIIDNDIAAYSCCKKHFEIMLETYDSLLSKSGEILIGEISLGYFDSGFPPTLQYLNKIAGKNGLRIERSFGILILIKTNPAG
jgi:hypothetical protein